MKKISKEEYLKRLEEINDKFIYELDDKVNSRTRIKELYPEFDFSKYEYNGCMEKSIVICPIHGEFLTSRDKLLVRKRTNKKVYGCPSCNKINKSSYEEEIANFIKESTNLEIIRNDRKVIYPKEIDIFLPELKIGIEFNGTYWHSDDFIAKYDINFNTAKEKHDYKTELCKSKGIKLIHISEEEYINNKKEILDNILSIIL